MQPLDEWSALNFTARMRDAASRVHRHGNYLPVTDHRRLAAYEVLDSLANNAYSTAPSSGVSNRDGFMLARRDAANAEIMNEYGDSNLLVESAVAAVLGDKQVIELDGDNELVDWVREWAESENFTAKLLQGETFAQKLGDAVFVVSPSLFAGRPKLKAYDPAFYFPDFEARPDGWELDADFPAVVHLVWEWEDTKTQTVYVRRVSWELRKLDTPIPSRWDSSREWTCWYRVVDYKRDSIAKNHTIYDRELGRGVVVQEWSDLMIDFIPVVHVPATVGDWGRSVLLMVSQVLADLIIADTDAYEIAANATAPMLATDPDIPVGGLTGAPVQQIGGSASWVDTSNNLDAIMKREQRLRQLIAENSRIPEAWLGRTDVSKVESGLLMSLAFEPLKAFRDNARRVRDFKLPLILKFALRIAQTYGWVGVGRTPVIKVALGGSLPSDKSNVFDAVRQLLPANAISRETAVTWLASVGVPSPEIEDELAAIERYAYDDMVKLVESTGNSMVAGERLGVPAATVSVNVTEG